MKKRKIYSVPLLLGGLFLFSACTDDNYDLSDIDTTTAIKFDNLVVPVNLDNIYLDQVLKIDDEDPENPVVVYTDGYGKQKYAIKIGGEFRSDPIYISQLTATDYASVNAFPVPTEGKNIVSFATDFQYTIGEGNVDDAIQRIYRMGLINPMEINLHFYYISSIEIPQISELILEIPESFTAFYKGAEFSNGEVSVNIIDGNLDQPVYVYAIDFGGGVEPTGPNGAKNLVFEGKIGIKSGYINSTPEGITADFSLSPFRANEISGAINYGVESPVLEPVSLENLPDFLREGESRLIIQNPQLYIYFGNPTTADFFTNLNIEPLGNGGNAIDVTMKGFQESIILASDTGDLTLAGEYPGAIYQKEESLKNILYGEGLPEYINFSLFDTFVRGDVLNLTLGEYLGVDGKYTFFTPLAFGADSQIIYQKSETDFFGDDMKAVNVEHLQLSAYPTTNLPFDVELTVYPLDKEGNHIYSNGKEVMASGLVNAHADGSKILDLNLDTPFTGLDGVEYRVSTIVRNEEALSPDQFIKLDKIRAKVTGEYVTKF